MDTPDALIVTAGHICLDLIPELRSELALALVPGALTKVGPMQTATGGAVANVGLALHRLGVPVRLMGKIGDDLIGRAIQDVLDARGSGLGGGMIVAPGEPSSYTVVVNPPDADRIFLHCPGANDTFSAADIDVDRLAGARLFHFGYPPLMRRTYADGGTELADLFRRVQAAEITTSLDMAAVDPASDAGSVDWAELLRRVLPHVDLYLPSLDETRAMLGLSGATVSVELLDGIARRLLDFGAAVVGLKLGDQGLYLRTSDDGERLWTAQFPESWLERQLMAPCFAVDVAGATGAGDCTIAGLLAAAVGGASPTEAMIAAVGVGACSCEATDATSGIPRWSKLQERIAAGWSRRPGSVAANAPGWRWDEGLGLFVGPEDGGA
jgi:sugar/nucleoside kinase (ribokinase family)